MHSQYFDSEGNPEDSNSATFSIHYNGDFSGNVILMKIESKEGKEEKVIEFELPAKILKAIVIEHFVGELISLLEDLGSEDMDNLLTTLKTIARG